MLRIKNTWACQVSLDPDLAILTGTQPAFSTQNLGRCQTGLFCRFTGKIAPFF
jgi:hypothetical protein